jgi:hypothetical protein
LAIQTLRADGKQVTQKAISKMTMIPQKRLRSYPGIKVLLVQFAMKRHADMQLNKKQREEWLLECIQAVMASLGADERIVTQVVLAKHLDLSVAALSKYPRVNQILKSLAEHNRNLKTKES